MAARKPVGSQSNGKRFGDDLDDRAEALDVCVRALLARVPTEGQTLSPGDALQMILDSMQLALDANRVFCDADAEYQHYSALQAAIDRRSTS